MSKDKDKVFISYSQKDQASARKLAKALESRGVRTWKDFEIRTGDKWQAKLEEALEQSKIFLLLISHEFLTSKWTNFELGVALSKASTSPDVSIIPLALKHINKSELPRPLRDWHLIEAEDITSSQAADKIVKVIESRNAAVA